MKIRIAQWLGEIAAIAALAVGCWWRLDPLAGIVVASLYVFLLVNSGEEETDAGTREDGA